MYKFDPKGEPVEASFRAIAIDQLDEAIADLDKGEAESRTLVHEGRRRCKKLRGLLRLVRPCFEAFDDENAALRDAAAGLSHLRDAEVQSHTLSELSKEDGGGPLAAIAKSIARTEPHGEATALKQFRDRLAAVRERAQEWSLTEQGVDALVPGLAKTYGDARKRMKAAHSKSDALHFHEWRKASKYHGFHLDLMKRAAPEMLAAMGDLSDRLSLLLGQHHDLAVLADAVRRAPERFGSDDDRALLHSVSEKKRESIEKDAFELGRQLYADKPRAVAKRFGFWWESAS